MEAYDGLSDLTNYLHRYIAQMEIVRANDPIMCKAFSSALKGVASTWFGTLRCKNFNDFKALEMAFLCHFMRLRSPLKMVHHFFQVLKHKDESLEDYIQRFQVESIQVVGLDNSMQLLAITQGFQRESRLIQQKREPSHYQG